MAEAAANEATVSAVLVAYQPAAPLPPKAEELPSTNAAAPPLRPPVAVQPSACVAVKSNEEDGGTRVDRTAALADAVTQDAAVGARRASRQSVVSAAGVANTDFGSPFLSSTW